MSLEQWAANGWLHRHETSEQEIGELFRIVDRDLEDGSLEELSADWRFGIAYNAALKLCTAVLYAAGFRARSALQHYRTIQALPLVMGNDQRETATYLEACRKKRNAAEYDAVGMVTEGEANELLSFVQEFRGTVIGWMRRNHPSLSPK
jgi:uncharacterized protein (UPF0332 family)